MSGGQVVNSAARVPEQPFARARLALRAKNMLFPSGCACNPRGRPAKPKPCRPSVPCASNEYPRAENPRVAGWRACIMPAHKKRCCGEQTTAYTRVVLRMRSRFFNLSFRQPPMRGRRTAFFVGVKGGLRPTLTVACCPAERADKTADFSKGLAAFSLVLECFSKSKWAGSRFRASPAFSKDGQDCRRRRIGHAVYSGADCSGRLCCFCQNLCFLFYRFPFLF